MLNIIFNKENIGNISYILFSKISSQKIFYHEDEAPKHITLESINIVINLQTS